jgi:hypothetical protein
LANDGPATVKLRSRIKAFIEHVVPWYDPEAERRRHLELRSEIDASVAARSRAVNAIHRSETVRMAYRHSARRLER